MVAMSTRLKKIVLLMILAFLTYWIAPPLFFHFPRIAIVTVISDGTNISNYEYASKSVECYAKIQQYDLIMANDKDYDCQQKDLFFRRHCVVAKILPKYDAVMFLDADSGVVNPSRRIEEFMEHGIDVTFYDRFYNWEIAMGSYIVRNTPYAISLLMELADYENKLPNSYHGTDNGALHIFLAKKLLPYNRVEFENCEKVYNQSKNIDDLFTYEACIRRLLGVSTIFGKVKIYPKATGWVRDDWLTSGVWNKEMDFMLHGWKSGQLAPLPEGPIRALPMNSSFWYNPLAGPIDIGKCSPLNFTWSYEPRLLGKRLEIEENYLEYGKSVVLDQIKSITRMVDLLSPNDLEKKSSWHFL